MKTRTQVVTILVVMAATGVSLGRQEKTTLEPEPQKLALAETASPGHTESGFPGTAPMSQPSRPSESRSRRRSPGTVQAALTAAPKGSSVMQIFKLKNAMAEEVANLIMNVCRVKAVSEARLNSVIVSTTAEQMKSVADLIKAVDVAPPEASKSQNAQDFIYRIYMFEIASGNRGMKAFSITLQTSALISSHEFLNAVGEDLRIVEFRQTGGGLPDAQFEILIQGKAVSDEAVKRLVEKFPESRIVELKWDDDEAFTDKIEASHYTQLPEQMQKHIHRFLGDDIQTVGYWFGNLSVPGSVEAPIGPYKLSLQLDTESDRMVQLQVDVEAVGEEEQIDEQTWRQQIDVILSNTITVKIGKPIIIGYNRESYGARKMGAMVIVPEADSFSSESENAGR